MHPRQSSSVCAQGSADPVAQTACPPPPVLALDGTALFQMQPSPSAWAHGIHYRPVADILSDALGYPRVSLHKLQAQTQE